MSRLASKLKQMTGEAAPAMGFRSASRQCEARKMLLIWNGASGSVPAGVDAVVAKVAGAEEVARLSGIAGKLPWGIVAVESKITPEQARSAGCDFVIVEPDAPVSWLAEKDIAKFVLVLGELEKLSAIRGLERLEIEGVAFGRSDGDYISLQNVMVCYTLTALRKPLLAFVSGTVNAFELKSLWDAGVDGIIVGGDGARIRAVKKLIDELPDRSKRKTDRVSALVPRVSVEPEVEGEEEDD